MRRLILILLTVWLQGCHGVTPLPAGHFEGSLLQRQNGIITQQPVCTDVTQKQQQGSLTVTDFQKNTLFTLSTTQSAPHTITLTVPTLQDPVRLTPEAECFVSQNANLQLASNTPNPTAPGSDLKIGPPNKVRLCFNSNKFLLEVTDSNHHALFTLSGDRFSHAAHFTLETPSPLSIQQAIHRALQTNFDSRIEFERLMQSKHTTKAAYLGLLPHLSLSSILGNLTPSVLSVFNTIGDLAPFLLPTRWFQAQEAQLKTTVESDAFLLMRANLATDIEGLSYTLKRDEAFLKVYANLILQLQHTIDQTQALETENKLAPGSTDHLLSFLGRFYGDSSTLNTLVRKDRAILAGALGFHNPAAITELSLEPTAEDQYPNREDYLQIEHAVPLLHPDYRELVLSRSFELRQLDALIQIAHLQKKELYFNWLDPSGNYNANLGFGLGATLAASQSNINQLLIQRDQLQTQVVHKLFLSIEEYNSAVNSYPNVEKNAQLQMRRLNLSLMNISKNPEINTQDTGDIFQDFAEALLRRETILADFRVSRSKLDRLLLQGYYNQIPLQDPSSQPMTPPQKSLIF